MNRSKKLFLTLTGSLLFLSPLTAKSALNKSVDDFSNINISEEIKEKSILNGLPKMIVFDEFRRYIERAFDEVRMLERTIDMMRRGAPGERAFDEVRMLERTIDMMRRNAPRELMRDAERAFAQVRMLERTIDGIRRDAPRYTERAFDQVRMLERTIDMMRRDAPRESAPRRSSIMEVYEKNKQWGKLQMQKRSLQVQIEKNKDKWTKDFIRRKEYEIKKITEKIRKLQEKLKKDYENSN